MCIDIILAPLVADDGDGEHAEAGGGAPHAEEHPGAARPRHQPQQRGHRGHAAAAAPSLGSLLASTRARVLLTCPHL